MENKEEIKTSGKILYIQFFPESSNINNYFSYPKSINSNKTNIQEFKIRKNNAYAITNNNELISWENDSNNSQNNNQDEPYYSKIIPSYVFNKIKFKSISLNNSICLCLDIHNKVLVWGKNVNGLLGLGYDIKSVSTPVYIEELKSLNITEISLSENHAVVISSQGSAYSWGLGKYGELGQECTIYTPFPLQINSENLYSKVYCGNYVTCFLDYEGHFSYFGIIVRNIEINNMNLTVKNLLEDESMYDGRTLIKEIIIEEIENEKIIKVEIGNGFVALLNEKGDLYVLEYGDKLTKLYTKYFCYDITISHNNIFGFAKKSNINNKITNYYLCQWPVKYLFQNSLSGDEWHSIFWKIKPEFNMNLKFKFVNIGLESENINKIFILDTNLDNINYIENKKYFEFDSKFNDSYNLRFKRSKSKNSTIINDTINKSKLSYKYLNKTYNNNLRLPIKNCEMDINKKQNNEKKINDINNNNDINRYKYEENKNNKDMNKENIDPNMIDYSIELKQRELKKYKNEISSFFKNYKNKKYNRNYNLFEIELNKLNSKNEELKFFKQNQGIYSKNNMQNSGINNRINLTMKNANNKEIVNNNMIYNQKEIYSNIDEFFGKESSNIIKNEDNYSDLIELSNTNLNYLSNNIDISNKIYNCNNSNNLLIASDRTLNFSENNHINRNNNYNKNFLPYYINGNESINLNSIISGKIDKSNNDFFSEYGNKQSRNNFIETNINKKELSQNTKGSKTYKTRNINNESKDNIEFNNKNNANEFIKKNINIPKNNDKTILNANSSNLIKKCFLNINEETSDQKSYFSLDNSCIYKRLKIKQNKNNLKLNHSSPNLLIIKYKNIKTNELKKNLINKNINKKEKNSINIKDDNNLNKQLSPLNFSEDKDFNIKSENDTKKYYKYNKVKKKPNNTNKNYLAYFCFLTGLYMKKICFKYIMNKIINYTKYLDKKYATKMIFRIIKKRIIFYEIKMLRRMKKIRKFYIKYEQKLKIKKKEKYSKKSF